MEPSWNNCKYCDEEFLMNEGDEFCSPSCEENWNERAYERQLSSYYGGDGPQTIQEQYQKAAEEKRRMR